MRRLLPNVFLLLMLLFLLPIYLENQRPEVLGLSILLLAAGFFLGYTNQPRGLETLAALTLILSFVGLLFFGRLLTGTPNGGYCFMTLWIFALLGVIYAFYRRAVFVERGQIMVVNQLPENRALVWTEGLHRPLKPFVERRMAALPAYELDIEQNIKNLNTRSLFNVNEVTVLVRYKVGQARDVVFCFPNREQAYEELVQERQAPRDDDTDQQVAFWTELIRRQMAVEIDQSVRTVVANVGGPADVARDRDQHARNIRQRLQQSVARWGMQILDLRLLDVVIDPERVRALNRDKIIERERLDAQRRAEIRAEEVRLVGQAQAEATARMVAEMVRTLQQSGTPLTTEELERVVLTAMQRMADQQQLGALFRDTLQAGATGTPASGQTVPLNNPGTGRP